MQRRRRAGLIAGGLVAAGLGLVLPRANAHPAPGHVIAGTETTVRGVLTVHATDAAGGGGVAEYTPSVGAPSVTITLDCVVVEPFFIWGFNLIPSTGHDAFLAGTGSDGSRYFIGVRDTTEVFTYDYALQVDGPETAGPCGASSAPGTSTLEATLTRGAILIDP